MKGLIRTLATLLAGFLLIPSALAASGDLAIYDSNVIFSNSYFLEGSSVRIWASISNNSDTDLLGSVRFTEGGNNIDADQPISALAGLTDDVFVDWTPSSYGYYEITVSVMPWDSSADDSSNNTVTKTVYVEQDTDHDGIANSQDEDLDGDGTLNDEDEFPSDSSESTDTDGDGTGNNADEDDDNDGVLDGEDDFPEDPMYSSDQDSDGIADEEDEDIDGDGLTNEEEVEAETNPTNPDTDADHVVDGTDIFPTNPTEWADTDGDGTGDNSDKDIDGDGILNEVDPLPSNSGPTAEIGQNIYLTDIGESVLLDASNSEDPDGEIVEYIWKFQTPEGEETESGSQVEKSFFSKGLQVATLTVLDDSGQSDSVDVNIRVLDYRFLLWALLFTLLLLLLAFYIIYRYNRRALERKKKKKPVKSKKKSKKKS